MPGERRTERIAASSQNPLRRLAGVCAVMALELGWAAFSPFIERAVEITTDAERELIVERLRAYAAV